MTQTATPRTSLHLFHPARRTLAIGGAVVTLVLLFLVGFLPRWHARKALVDATAAAGDAREVSVIHPRMEEGRRSLTLPGNLQALEATAVYARATGYVRRWYADIGDRVTEGQLLAELDTPDLDQQLENARKMLNQTRASLEQAAANEKYAVENAKRYQGLIQEQAVSQQEVDQTRSQADIGVANVHAAQAAIAAQMATVHQLEDLKSFARITSPFAGTITARNIDRGNLVVPGTAAGKPLYAIAISNPLRVFVQVPQPFAAGIEVGTPVTIRVRQYPGRDFPAKVTRFSGAIDPASRTLTVEAQVANDQAELFPGAYADVTLNGRLSHGVAVVPVAAMLFDAQGTRVATVDTSSKVHFLRVTVGRDLGQEVEVVDGLTGNENVIAAPSADLAEGVPVEVAPPVTASKP